MDIPFLLLVGIVTLIFVLVIISKLTRHLEPPRSRAPARPRAPHVPRVEDLIAYADRSDSALSLVFSALQAEQIRFSNFERQDLKLVDLLQIVRRLSNCGEDLREKDAEYIRAFTVCCPGHDLSYAPTQRIRGLVAETEEAGFRCLGLLASAEHPDRRIVAKLYTSFASDIAGRGAKRSAVLRDLETEILKSSYTSSECAESFQSGHNDWRVADSDPSHVDGSEQYRLLLGLPTGFSKSEVKRAYRSKVTEWHPDRLEGMAPELKATANARMSEINEAYRALAASTETTLTD